MTAIATLGLAARKYGEEDPVEKVYAQFVTQGQCDSFLVI
jgi:hypothetical protein